MADRLFSFVAGEFGKWRVLNIKTITGDPLPQIPRLNIMPGKVFQDSSHVKWILHGIVSNQRYVVKDEHRELLLKQPVLERPEATCAAFIPIRKNKKWWDLSQDERRQIFEEQSHHIEIGMKYLPAIARRLHHCRDLSENEPFDFLTWFEYSPQHSDDFEKLLVELRKSTEWKYVDREIDIRLALDVPDPPPLRR
jgi:chlorite dismutase